MHASTIVVEGSEHFRPGGSRPVVTIGNFDGVHLGHQALIRRARTLAAELGGSVWAYTFDPPPSMVMAPDKAGPRVQLLEHKIERLAEAGVDGVLVEPFSRAFSVQPPEDFISTILQQRLQVAGVVVGWDFHFGAKRAGTVELLQQVMDCPVVQVSAVELDDEVISSSRIRRVVQAGDVAQAARCLGRPHEVPGVVVRGDALGRKLGFPTANLQVPAGLLRPADGTYAAWTRVQGRTWPSVVHLGRRPTVGGSQARFEVHILDYQGDLYGHQLTVGFVERIRGEQRFEDVKALQTQIGHDIARARVMLGVQ